MPRSSSQPARAFTLIELLTVIVIIAILIGILLPVISKVRTSAYRATTQATINTLVAGIEAYYQAFNAYPTQITDSSGTPKAATSSTTSIALTGATPVPPSDSESLVLWLIGGLHVDTTAGTFTYDRGYVGSGPISLTYLQNFKTYKPFIGTDLKLSEGLMNTAGSYYAAVGFNDTNVPEFLDDFPGHPMPILYLPANAGATGVVNASATANSSYQYDLANPIHYYGVPLTPTFNGGWNKYFGDPNSFNGSVYTQARQKDRYILISAGPDGKYGTADDITSFGTPGQ